MIGSHLLFHLVKKGESVRATYRSADTLDKVTKVFGYYSDNPSSLMERIDWVQANITNIGQLEDTFKDINYVYHCAALISFDPKLYKALAKTNVEGTANVVNLCLKHGIEKLCHVSSIATIGPSLKGNMATENNEWSDNHVSVYSITKHDAELEVWRGSQEGLDVVIVNPGVVIGPGFWKSGSGTFFPYAGKGKKSFIPGGTGFVTVNDVVSAMMTLMQSNIVQEKFILVNQNLSYGELIQKIATKLGVEPPTRKISFWMMELFWRLDWLRSNLRGKRRRLTKIMTKGLYNQELYSSAKLVDSIDFTFEDLDAAITFCCDKFKD